MSNVDTALNVYVDHMNRLEKESWADHPHLARPFVVETGRKFYKVIKEGTKMCTSRTVHSFVDRKTGDLYKPASWAQPAKGARFNLVSELDKVMQVADVHGGYLYKR